MQSRFAGHYLLSDRGSPDEVNKLANLMGKNKQGVNNFKVPPYEVEPQSSEVAYQWLQTYFLPDTLINSVIVGIGLGGLLAAKLQEDYPARNLSVIAINAPTADGLIHLTPNSQSRVALYSSSYPPLAAHCDWVSYTPQVYDVAWLQHGIKNTKYALAYLMAAYLLKEDVSSQVGAIANFGTNQHDLTGRL